MGDVAGDEAVLVRVHSECLTGDVFGSVKCDCGPQLHESMRLVTEAGRGVVVYLRGHEGRGIGLSHKLRAYELQDAGLDTVDANLELGLPVDSREYAIGAQILVDLGVRNLRLLTNNPAKYRGLEGFGLTITERVGLHLPAHPESEHYLRTKRDRMGHLLPDDLDHSTVAEARVRPGPARSSWSAVRGAARSTQRTRRTGRRSSPGRGSRRLPARCSR